MKRRNIISALACSMVAFAFTACTDVWEEHYQPSPELNADETLWELIANDSTLTDFADFLKATGYDTLLTKNRCYTVWAPVNGKSEYFTQHNANDKSKVEVYRKEFVENHIADYSHVAGGRLAEDNQVRMLNGKYISFENASGKFAFKGIGLKAQNIPAKNGILHKIDGYADFTANIWEQLAKEESLDSLWNFLYKDYKREPNWAASVQGPMVDGQIQYLDTAWSVTCPWWNSLGRLNREDSSYTMFAPTNEAWVELYEDINQYFNYATGFGRKGDSIRDVVVKEFMVRNLVFSDKVNKKFVRENEQYPYDSLVSNYNYAYTYEPLVFGTEEVRKLYDGLEGRQPLALSNGTLNIVSKLNYDPLVCWHDTIRIEGENLIGGYTGNNAATDNEYVNAAKEVVTIHRDSLMYDSISGGAVGVYRGDNQNPELSFRLNNVLSARYEVKIVVVAPDKLKWYDTTYVKPNHFYAELVCANKDATDALETIRLGRKDSCSVYGRSIYSIPSRGMDTITLVPLSGDDTPTGKEYVEIPTCEYNEESLLDGLYQTKLSIKSMADLNKTYTSYIKDVESYAEAVKSRDASYEAWTSLPIYQEIEDLNEEIEGLNEEIANNPENLEELEAELKKLETEKSSLERKREYRDAKTAYENAVRKVEEKKGIVEDNDRSTSFMDNTLRIDQVILVPVRFDE